MLKNIKDLWSKMCLEGIKLPFLFDPTTQLPSITLALLYVTSLIMLGSLITLHFQSELLTATLTSIMVWLLAYIMYRMRKLDKVKLDLDDKSIELQGSDEPEKENK